MADTASNFSKEDILETGNGTGGMGGDREIEIKGRGVEIEIHRVMNYWTSLGEWLDIDCRVRPQKLLFEKDMLNLEDSVRDLAKETNLAISGAMNEVYQLVSFYNVFAGVVLTAVSTSSRLECQHLWSPVGLCLFTYSMIIVIAHMKFQTVSHLEAGLEGERSTVMATVKEIDAHLQRRATAVPQVYDGRLAGFEDWEFSKFVRAPVSRREAWHDGWKRSIILIPLLTVFTAGLVGSFIHILCFSKNPSSQA